MMRSAYAVTLKWLPLAVGLTLVCGLAYAIAQQTYRQGANDPQVMMAHDIAAAVEGGRRPDELVSRDTVDPTKSLAPFVIVMDPDGRVLVSSLEVGGKSLTPPMGVLQAAKAQGENRVTWQPRPDARIAAVVVPIGKGADGYVLAGRSLREAESRVDSLGRMTLAGWAATMLATLAAVAIAIRMERPAP